MKILVKCSGFVGDHLFATGIADWYANLSIKECIVDYVVDVYQVIELFTNDPNINNVFHKSEDIPKHYDIEYSLPPVDQSIPPPQYFKSYCDIPTPDSTYKIYTNSGLDSAAKIMLPKNGKKNIAWQANWEEKSFLFHRNQYEAGINHPPDLGYGGKRRDINKIITGLKAHYNLIPVGFPPGTPNKKEDPIGGFMSAGMYSATASIIKMCDYMIGGESGLINLAAGVGTKTIITGDFVHQLYGWNGCIKKIQEPKLGPEFYFPNEGHISLDPYLTDDEVASQMKEIICT